MRLIDADQIIAEQAVKFNSRHRQEDLDKCVSLSIVTALQKAPEVDAVPVTRCRDCVHRGETNRQDIFVCQAFYGELPGNFYCYLGETADKSPMTSRYNKE